MPPCNPRTTVPTMSLLLVVRARRGTFPHLAGWAETRRVRRWKSKPACAGFLHRETTAMAGPKPNVVCQQCAPGVLTEAGLTPQIGSLQRRLEASNTRLAAVRHSMRQLCAPWYLSIFKLRRRENNQRGLHVSQSQRGPAKAAFQKIPRTNRRFGGGAGGLQAEQRTTAVDREIDAIRNVRRAVCTDRSILHQRKGVVKYFILVMRVSNGWSPVR
jgi:hypothetical protein